MFGSPVSIEKEQDPGTAKLIGWLRWYLISENRLAPTLGITEVKLDGRVPDMSRAKNKVFSEYTDIVVRGSVHTPNEPCDVLLPHEIWMKLQQVQNEPLGIEGHVDL